MKTHVDFRGISLHLGRWCQEEHSLGVVQYFMELQAEFCEGEMLAEAESSSELSLLLVSELSFPF